MIVVTNTKHFFPSVTELSVLNRQSFTLAMQCLHGIPTLSRASEKNVLDCIVIILPHVSAAIDRRDERVEEYEPVRGRFAGNRVSIARRKIRYRFRVHTKEMTLSMHRKMDRILFPFPGTHQPSASRGPRSARNSVARRSRSTGTREGKEGMRS